MICREEATGKCILLGEHFVGYGLPALAMPLEDLWCHVTIEPSSHLRFSATVPGGHDPEAIQSLMARALYGAADALRIDLRANPMHVHSAANFPVSRGLGSSAAFAVALSRALNEYRVRTFGPEHVASWMELERSALAVDSVYHGRSSGLDTATVFAGVPVRFENGKVVREIQNKALDFVVVDGGDRPSCDVQIQKVSQFAERNPGEWDRMKVVMEESVNLMEAALANGHSDTAVLQMARAQDILMGLDLVTDRVLELLLLAQSFGALGGKISGAGGGGAVLLACRPEAGEELARRMSENGVSVFGVNGAKGR